MQTYIYWELHLKNEFLVRKTKNFNKVLTVWYEKWLLRTIKQGIWNVNTHFSVHLFLWFLNSSVSFVSMSIPNKLNNFDTLFYVLEINISVFLVNKL